MEAAALDNLVLKFGSSLGQPSLVIDLTSSVTIFVGPNNSGKSLVLKEITRFFSEDRDKKPSILDTMNFKPLSEDNANRFIERSSVIHEGGGDEPDVERVTICADGRTRRFHKNNLMNWLVDPNSNKSTIIDAFWKRSILNLDGSARLRLLNKLPRGDLKNPTNNFQKLLMNNDLRAELRKIIHDALGLYFVLDHFEGEHLVAKFGDSKPPDEKSYEDETLRYMAEALNVSDVSDGVRAYSGVILELLVASPRIVMIDEPEAFLHPSLSLSLGKHIAETASKENKHIFVATHSSQFLMGAILSGAKVNIVRLTHSGDVNTARILRHDQLNFLMRNPLLRSAGVLEGLFYDNVVVGEADADRAFYQEINERLRACDDKRSVPRCLFLNAQGKDTIPFILDPLRQMGIPAAAVVDIDLFSQGGKPWKRHLETCGLPNMQINALNHARKAALDALSKADPSFKRKGGVSLLTEDERLGVMKLIDDLAEYGLFVVEDGEIEQWLAELEVSRDKNAWLHNIFDKMGSDPEAEGYVMPGQGDVWDFVGKMQVWLSDQKRKGMPA